VRAKSEESARPRRGRVGEGRRWLVFGLVALGLLVVSVSGALVTVSTTDPSRPGSDQGSAVDPGATPRPSATPDSVVTRADGSTVETSAGTIVIRPAAPEGDVVVYFHGAGQTATTVLDDPETSALVDSLVRAGYTVASRDAGGNSWGDDSSVRDYVDLVADVRPAGPRAHVFFVAESMGAVAAAQVAARTDVSAWAAVYPVCDLASIVDPVLRSQIVAAYGESAPAGRSPVAWPDVPVATWASPDDTVVDAEVNGAACTARVGGDFTSTVGEHGDASNFDAASVLRFFSEHGGLGVTQ